MKKILTIAFLYISTSVLALNIEGIVYNTKNKTPISNCKLELFQNGELLETKNTDSEGKFSIEVNTNQNYKIKFSKSFYNSETVSFYTNSEFLNAKPNIEVKLNSVNEVPNPENVEDIGNMSSLPEGYKLIEVKPLKYLENESTGFNVRKTYVENKPTVNVNEFQTAFNKESLNSNAFINQENAPSSYYLGGNIYYGAGKALLTNEVKEVLAEIAQKINNKEFAKINIKAFADSERENPVANEISKLRAEEVLKYFMLQNVDFSKLSILIVGNTDSQNECNKDIKCTEAQHQENRRVEITFLK